MQGLSLDPIDRVCCTELHLEWADGREYWSEDPAEVARAEIRQGCAPFWSRDEVRPCLILKI